MCVHHYPPPLGEARFPPAPSPWHFSCSNKHSPQPFVNPALPWTLDKPVSTHRHVGDDAVELRLDRPRHLAQRLLVHLDLRNGPIV